MARLSKREETLQKRDYRSRKRLSKIAGYLEEIKQISKDEKVLAITNEALSLVNQKQAIQ